MCGIAGVLGARPDDARAERVLAAMHHRGPDARGRHDTVLNGQALTLLHTRLAIIDLDERADQPFERDGCVLVFNGEVYNYVELRAQLEARGHAFRTSSDTEVIVAAYREWGDGFEERFEGMWAFALLDRDQGRLLLSRDRFGEKPLYWTESGGALYFGSQVGFLAGLSGKKPEVDTDQLRRYLVNGYKSLYKEPRTWHRDVHEIPAGSTAVLRGPTSPQPRVWWVPEHRPVDMTREEALEGARERLLDAVELRLRADVPIALCLSGGVDSSALAAIAVRHFGRDVHTFSIIDEDERYDESDNIRVTLAELGCPHHLIHTSTEGFFGRLEDLISYRRAPIVTLTYYLHSFLSEAVSAAGFKVAISGTAADELFTGYYDHYGFWLAQMRDRPDFSLLLEQWRESYGRFVRNPLLQDPLAFAKNPKQREHIYLDAESFAGLLVGPFDEDFEESTYAGELLRNRMINELRHEAVPVILREDDLNSMRYSVENRSPYLDSRLTEFLYTVPAEHLIVDGYPKWLLRSVVEGLLPDSVRLDRRKRGFNAPIDSLIDRSDPAVMERLLAPGPIFDLVQRNGMERYVRRDLQDNSLSKFMFSFVSARTFLDLHEEWTP